MNPDRNGNIVCFVFCWCFPALAPYHVAHTLFGVSVLAGATLPAVGMALLLTLFSTRRNLVLRLLPAAAGMAFLAAANLLLAGWQDIHAAAALVAAPLVTAFAVMPFLHFLQYQFEREQRRAKFRRQHGDAARGAAH